MAAADGLLPEIAEAEAEGEVRRIYGEIRSAFVVPAVSTIFRHVATVPGVLEWAWATLGPAVASGEFQALAQDLAENTASPPMFAPLSRAALRSMGVDGRAEAAIRDVCDAYNRQNPLNLLFACILRRLLAEGPGGGPYAPTATRWRRPPPLPPLVGMVAPAAMPPALAELVAELGSRGFREGRRWVPGVYRHFANWPAFMTHLGAVLGPLFESGVLDTAAAEMVARAEESAAGLVRRLGAPAGHVPPPADRTIALTEVLDGLVPKIPEMIVICTAVRRALPSS